MKKHLKWLLLLLLLPPVFLPQILSSPLGKPFFIRSAEAKINGRIEIGSLTLSWFGPQKYRAVHFVGSAITAAAEEIQVDTPLWSLSQITKGLTVQNGSLLYLQNGKIENLNGTMSRGDFRVTGKTRNGAISLEGKLHAPDHFEGKIDLSDFPVAALDPFYPLSPLLGPYLNLKGEANLNQNQGSLHLAIDATNIQTILEGKLSDHSLTLTAPLDASIHLTKELSNLLFQEVNPLFLSSVTAKKPIHLHLDAPSFFFPLQPFSLASFKATGVLDLGQLECKKGKVLASLLALLKAETLTQTQKMKGWFTPLSFQVENGVLLADRMDVLLAGSIHICTWGNIDLINDQVQMYLGLPADTLQTAFKVQNLPANYVLKIPIRGSTKDPELVKGQATARIATLIASEQLPNKGFFGGLVNAFTQAKEDKEVPPAKRPFPWE